jgi:hypothetical protein
MAWSTTGIGPVYYRHGLIHYRHWPRLLPVSAWFISGMIGFSAVYNPYLLASGLN